MDIRPEIDNYIIKSIDHALGLPVDIHTLELKLKASEEAQMRYREQYLKLGLRMKEKDEIIERTRAEASLNAQAIRKFVEENRKLVEECVNLSNQCVKWEKECSLYDRDREVLMEFGNEANERAKEAECRVRVLEEELRRVLNELERTKARDSQEARLSCVDTVDEEKLLLSAVETVLSKDETESSAKTFLETNKKHVTFNKLHMMWNQLKPSTRMAISMIAELKRLENDKEHMRINLHRAEDEARLLSEKNNIIDEENKRLLKQLKEKMNSASGGITRGQKRKSSSRISSPIDKLDFTDTELGRCPLSPLLHNSPDKKMHKK